MAVGFMPDMFEVTSGLASDFQACIVHASVKIWDYKGKGDGGPRTTVNVKVMPLPGQDIPLQNQFYGASKPEIHQPSLDGKPHSPAPNGEGPYFSFMGQLQLDKTTGQYTLEKGLPANSNWQHFTETVVACLTASGVPLDRMASGNVEVALVGIKGFFTRVEQKDRNFKDDEKKGADKKKGDILVLARFDGYATPEELAHLRALAAQQEQQQAQGATPGQMPGQPSSMPTAFNPAAFNPAAAAPPPTAPVYAAPTYPAAATPIAAPAYAPAPAPTYAPPGAAAPVTYMPPPATAAAGGPPAPSQQVVQQLTAMIADKLRGSGGTVARSTLGITAATHPSFLQSPERDAILAFVSADGPFWSENALWAYDPASGNCMLRA